MDVLVIESAPGIAATLEHRLVRDGHEVISCNDSKGGPCAGVESNDVCPLRHHIDVAVLARQRGTAPTLNEMGAVCALRHRVPLVTLYPGDEFGPGASTEIAAAVARRAVEARYEAVIRKQVGHAVDDITVQREYQRIHVTITVATSMSALTIHRLVDRVRQAVRAHDAHTETVDISVVRADPAVD
jgi:hypothetical protein